MRHASLFSGIGGFDLAAQWMGWENVFQVEIDKFCQKVLEKNFPNTKRYGDIKQFNGTEWTGSIDVLTGGFPCQPYSIAGKRKGNKDDRHLWPEMLRVIGEIQPAYIVGENVHGILSWSRGMVFESVQTDLENKGYEVQSFILPACGKDANHERFRVWFVAHSSKFVKHSPLQSENGKVVERSTKVGSQDRELVTVVPGVLEGFREWRSMGEPCLVREDDGISDVLDRLGAIGNAIVPQVAFEIFKAIEHENQNL